MRVDQETAIRRLRQASDAFARAAVAGDYAKFAANLYDVTGLLFEHALIRSTLDETVAKQRFDVEAGLAYWWQAHLGDLPRELAWGRKFLQDVLQSTSRRQDAKSKSESGQFWDEVQAVLGSKQPAGSCARDIRGTIALAETVDDVRAAAPDVCSQIARALEFCLRLDEPLRRAGCPTEDANELKELITQIGQRVANLHGEYGFLRNTMVATAVEPLVQDLSSFHRLLGSIAQRTEAPASALSPIELTRTLFHRQDQIIKLVETVINGVTANRARRHVLNRMRSYFEHFGRSALMRRIRAETVTKKYQDIENIIQEELDRFFFQEGFFPVIHSEISGGKLDSFVHEAASVLSETGQTEPPLLIELKRSIDLQSDVTAKSVLAAVRQAAQQAETYRRGVSAHTPWAATEAFGVVFYNGPHRYSCDIENVWLVYVGDAKPSTAIVSLSTID